MTRTQDVTFQSQGDKLIGIIDYNDAGDQPTVLFIHGSRPSDRTYARYLAEPLAAAGFSCLRIDLSGHGESEGDLQNSVARFNQDAAAALTLMVPDKPLVVVGSSMGGHIALSLLGQADIKGIILFAPAVYSESMVQTPYQIRGSTLDFYGENPDIVKRLQNYQGNFLHIIGQHDDVIPKACAKMLQSHCAATKTCEFHVIPDAPHPLTRWLAENPVQQKAVIDKVVNFVKAIV